MAEKYKAPKAEMRELAKGVYAFLQPAFPFQSNQGLIVGKNWTTIVDSQTNKYQIESFISKVKSVTDKPARFLINTHFDPDHVWTNYYFPEATCIATTVTRKETVRLHPYNLVTLRQMMPEPIMSFDGSKMTPQDMTFDGTLTVYDGDHEIRFIDMGSAHTISDTVIYLPKEKIVYCGDLVMVGMPEAGIMVSKGSYHMIEVMSNLANFDAEQYVPGHGNVIVDREYIAKVAIETAEYLLMLREEARKLFNKGMTYAEAADKIDYSKFKKWGDKEKLYSVTFGNLSRAWSEFKGELPLGRHGPGTELEETMAKNQRNPDGTRKDRIDLGYNRPWEDWE